MTDENRSLEKDIDEVKHNLDLHMQDCVYHRREQSNILHGVRESIKNIHQWQRWSSVFAYIIGVILLIAYLFGVEGIQQTLAIVDQVKP